MYEKIENFLKTRPLGIAMYAFVRGLLSIMPLPFHAVNMTDMLSYMFILYHDTPSRIDYELPRKFPMIALCIIVASTLTYLFSSLSLPFTTLLNFSYGCFILYSLYGKDSTDVINEINVETLDIFNRILSLGFTCDDTNFQNNEVVGLAHSMIINTALRAFSSFIKIPIITLLILKASDYAVTAMTVNTLSIIADKYRLIAFDEYEKQKKASSTYFNSFVDQCMRPFKDLFKSTDRPEVEMTGRNDNNPESSL